MYQSMSRTVNRIIQSNQFAEINCFASIAYSNSKFGRVIFLFVRLGMNVHDWMEETRFALIIMIAVIVIYCWSIAFIINFTVKIETLTLDDRDAHAMPVQRNLMIFIGNGFFPHSLVPPISLSFLCSGDFFLSSLLSLVFWISATRIGYYNLIDSHQRN